MLEKNQGVKTFICLGLAFVALGGCGNHKVNLIKKGVVHLEISEKERASIKRAQVFHAEVYQEGNDLIVSGEIKRRSRFSNFKGHADVMILSPEGDLTKEVSVPYYPRQIPENAPHTSSFSLRLSLVVPDGTTIRVRYHDDPHIRLDEFQDEERYENKLRLMLSDIGQ